MCQWGSKNYCHGIKENRLQNQWLEFLPQEDDTWYGSDIAYILLNSYLHQLALKVNCFEWKLVLLYHFSSIKIPRYLLLPNTVMSCYHCNCKTFKAPNNIKKLVPISEHPKCSICLTYTDSRPGARGWFASLTTTSAAETILPNFAIYTVIQKYISVKVHTIN